jgi:hypothetical protein
VAEDNDFEELDLTGNESGQSEEEAADFDFAPLEETAAEPLAEPLAEAAEVEPGAELAQSDAAETVDLSSSEAGPTAHDHDLDEEEEEEKEPSKLPVLLEIIAVIAVPVALVGLYFYGKIEYWTAGYAVGIAFVPYVLWKGRASSTVFTVFLGCVLVAEMTAIYVLFVELSLYKFDLKARTGKQQRVAVTQPVERELVGSTGFSRFETPRPA